MLLSDLTDLGLLNVLNEGGFGIRGVNDGPFAALVVIQ